TARWTRRHRSVVASVVTLMLITFVGCLVGVVMIAREHSETKAAYEREHQKAQEASQQRARAEASFQQARQAVDFFTQVSEEELPHTPELQRVRRRFLEGAL